MGASGTGGFRTLVPIEHRRYLVLAYFAVIKLELWSEPCLLRASCFCVHTIENGVHVANSKFANAVSVFEIYFSFSEVKASVVSVT